MRYWAIRLFAAILKIHAFVFAFVACGWFIVMLTMLDMVRDMAAARGLFFDGGPFVLALLLGWVLSGWLTTCLWLFAFAQLLELFTDIHSELRSLRLEMRQVIALARHEP